MKRIWLAIILVVGFVSLYPFDFRMTNPAAGSLGNFLSTCCQLSSRGDILGNFILFLPVGFAGMLALPDDRATFTRLAQVLLASIVYALLLQVAQFYLPSRDESLQDVIWNSFGALAGGALASLSATYPRHHTEGGSTALAVIPSVLIGAWLAYRLFPFIPSLDLQLWKDSVKPLLSGDLSLATVTRNCAAWALTGYLLNHARADARLDRYLALLAAGTVALEILIVANTVSASNVLGSALGITAWYGFLRGRTKPEIWLLTGLALAVVISGLTPLAFRTLPAEFSWMPFQGFLGGSMYVNSQSALEKLFLYAGCVYLCRQLAVPFLPTALLASAVVGVIELAQTQLVGHTPEITDPVLVLMAALGMRTLEKSTASFTQDKRVRIGTAPSRPTAHREPVRLRSGQFAFLEELATEAGLTTAEMAVRIFDHVTQTMHSALVSRSADEIARRLVATLPQPDPTLPASPKRPRWVTVDVPFPEAQFALLTAISDELGMSRSRVVRRLIARFIATLGSTPKNGKLR